MVSVFATNSWPLISPRANRPTFPHAPPPQSLTAPPNPPAIRQSAPYTIVSHPVLKHKLTQLRDVSTPPAEFRRLVKEISTILGVKASESLELTEVPNVSRRAWSGGGRTVAGWCDGGGGPCQW